jgi:repressor LexA
MRDLTTRQIELLRCIAYHIREHGFPPSFRELGLYLGIASWRGAGIGDHMRALERKGMISFAFKRSRGITLLGPARPHIADIGVQTHAPVVNVTPPKRCRRCQTVTFARRCWLCRRGRYPSPPTVECKPFRIESIEVVA